MYLTDAQTLQAVADSLKAGGVDALLATAPQWSNINSEAHASAYQEIVGRLLNRGFTLAQIQGWDRGGEFELALTRFWALTNGGGLSAYDMDSVKLFDRRKDLDNVIVFVNGVFVNPTAQQPGTVNFGTQAGVVHVRPGASDSSRHHHDWDREW